MTLHSLTRSYKFGDANKSDTLAFRAAAGRFATGVTIVTTMSETVPIGVTANSFTSVSLDPPLILVCLGKALGCVDAFSDTEHFAVNVLKSAQRDTSVRFATKGIDRFDGTDWNVSETNTPLLDDALARIECLKHSQMDYGDHTIFIGQVLSCTYDPTDEPLLYFGGEYRSLQND
ncbi:MAG: flavin reductase family protein [Pseudomonadota bacterium]